jgi:arginine decarboxylase
MPRMKKEQSPYGVDEWGSGYFAIGASGHLLVRPFRDQRSIDLVEIVRRSAAEGLTPPLLVRFPQILHTRLQHLYACFDRAMEEFDYAGHYRSIFPLKVNPMRAVVASLIRAGRPGAFGLEVGSKGELAIALAQRLPAGSWICINGFKDRRIVEMATAAAGRDPEVVAVVERLSEIPLLVAEARRQQRCPLLGVRCRLNSRGSGRWEASGGETSKFGMGASELLYAVEMLEREQLLPRLQVLHYHIGSQITSVRRIKDAVKEAARIYAKLQQRGVPLTTLNVGGGLGIDYDGSKTPSDSSVNYTPQEFANNVVYTVKEVCDEEEVPLPALVSESGRALTAHHSLLITNCESRESDVPVDFTHREVSSPPEPRSPESPDDEEPTQIAEMAAIAAEISVKNFREYYHDAVVTRGEILTLFDLGYLTLEQRAVAEQHFYDICRQALAFARQTRFVSDEFRVLEKAFRTKYVTNFSVFRSVPDAWAVKQLFPVLPIHRLHETPTEKGILVDLTCDSDGVIDTFVDVRDVKEVLELHAETNGRPYLLAICLLGAYQEIMGDHHNLFGKPGEVAARLDGNELSIEIISHGDSIGEMVRLAGYHLEEMKTTLGEVLGRRGSAPRNPGILERWEELWVGDSYLVGNREAFEDVD